MVRIALACARHRRAVLGIWVLILIGLSLLSKALPAQYANNITLPGTESHAAAEILDKQFTNQSGDRSQIVFAADSGTLSNPATQARATKMLADVAKLPHVSEVQSPWSPNGRGQIAKSNQVAFATVTFDKFAQELAIPDIERVITTAKKARGEGLQVELGGAAISRTERAKPALTEAIGVMAAIVILLLTFGSFVAMGLPIATALFGLGSGLALVALGSRVLDTADFAPQLSAMIGLGVGIDYALFIVTRFRDAYSNNSGDLESATVEAMDTAGRAVLFAGLTVVIAILGMVLLGINFLYGVAVATSVVVLVSVLASMTLTPALLSFPRIGSAIGKGRKGRGKPSGEGQLWGRWADFVVKRRWVFAILGIVLLVGLTIPTFSMRQLHNDAGNDSTSQTTRKAYDLLAKGFGPGFNGPLQFVVQIPAKTSPAAVTQVAAAIKTEPGIADVSKPTFNRSKSAATFTAYPTTAPQAAETTDLVNHLRTQVTPALGNRTNTTVLVGGFTPATIDLADTFSAKLPLFIGLVVLLSALLLMLVFRSLIVPLKAALMNLLSIGAALGVVTLVFQEGYGAGLLGVQPGPIEPFLPVMMFAIIFGLSMDYEVFIVSRIREEWLATDDARLSVRNGLAATGRVVTAAAAIMICVFASFMFGGDRVIKMFGLGLATAVFIDAFVIRVILLPAVMDLAARASWWLPAWLDRLLPNVAVEGRRDSHYSFR